MSDIEHARLLMRMAHKDLKALGGMLDAEVFDDEIFGFHAQQAVEKALKAWLSFLGVRYPKKYDLNLLISMLRRNGQHVPTQFLALTDLTDSAVQFRYDLIDYQPHQIDRPHVLREVADLVDFVAKIVVKK